MFSFRKALWIIGNQHNSSHSCLDMLLVWCNIMHHTVTHILQWLSCLQEQWSVHLVLIAGRSLPHWPKNLPTCSSGCRWWLQVGLLEPPAVAAMLANPGLAQPWLGTICSYAVLAFNLTSAPCNTIQLQPVDIVTAWTGPGLRQQAQRSSHDHLPA